ncbi:MAG: hypothetical protein AB4911_17615 [Oscillochloridaceae bacterium umkhey_bin13]
MLASLWARGRNLLERPRWRRAAVALLVLAGLAVALVIVARDWANLVAYDWRFDGPYLALSAVAYAGALALAVVAWATVMRALRAHLAWRQHARFYLYSWLARRLPTPAPFVASRVLLYEQAGVPPRLTLIGMLWEQIMLIASAGVLVVILFPLTPLLSGSIPVVPVALIALGSLILVMQPRILGAGLNWFLRRWGREPLNDYLGLRATLGVLALHSLLWLLGGMILFLMVRSIYPLEWAALPLIIQIWAASGLVGSLAFVVPVDLGFRDVSMAVLLTLVVPLSVALIIVVLLRLWITVNEIFWAMVFSRF